MSIGPSVTPRLFADIWGDPRRRGEFMVGIGAPGAPSRVRAAALVSGAESVLDVGCGPGAFLQTLAATRPDNMPRYVGVDPVPGMLDLAWGVTEANPVRCCGDFVVGQAEELPFDDQEFDAVVARHLLEHLEDPYPALREICRVARRRVVLVFSQWPHDGPRSLLTDAHLRALRFSHPAPLLRAELERGGFPDAMVENFTPAQRGRLDPRESVWWCKRDGIRWSHEERE